LSPECYGDYRPFDASDSRRFKIRLEKVEKIINNYQFREFGLKYLLP
jgi:hypothetical protein